MDVILCSVLIVDMILLSAWHLSCLVSCFLSLPLVHRMSAAITINLAHGGRYFKSIEEVICFLDDLPPKAQYDAQWMIAEQLFSCNIKAKDDEIDQSSLSWISLRC